MAMVVYGEHAFASVSPFLILAEREIASPNALGVEKGESIW
jgi:hypothetical protein